MGEVKKLVEEGKIKYIGLSESSVETIKRAHKLHPITALQMEELGIGCYRELGIGIVAYSPLGRGFCRGRVVAETMPNGSQLANYRRFNGENLEKNKLLYPRVSMKHGCTVPKLALAWLLHQGDDIVPIPGTTKVKNIMNNVGSLGLKLGEEDLKEICYAVPVDEVISKREMGILSEYTWKFANTPSK
ncbi:putative aldo-keto reductase 1 [Hibiscus syriacus]|uniref:Aldo-keto reductase 1 n=1 Tax=Hibiscus syriacus TaxID=106335 RepID=A0A6A2YJM8_HIBSY|nr:putative aldo-keto reductase 1 [Hibiscus syriacus]